jgi:hypothetical protein
LRPTTRRAALASVGTVVVGLAVGLAPAVNAAAPSPGTVTVSPSTVVAGAPTTLEFTVDPRGLSHNGHIALSVPDGWAAPQTADPSAAGYVTATAPAGCTPVVDGATVTLTGNCLSGNRVAVDLANEIDTVAGPTDFAIVASGALTGGRPISGDAIVTVTPAAPAEIVFTQQPGDTGVEIQAGDQPPIWHPFDPPVAVALYDAYGNLATGYPDHVAIVGATPGIWNGTTTVTADPATATATFPGVSDGTGGCELFLDRTMTVSDTDRSDVTATSDPYCSRHANDQGQLGGGG